MYELWDSSPVEMEDHRLAVIGHDFAPAPVERYQTNPDVDDVYALDDTVVSGDPNFALSEDEFLLNPGLGLPFSLKNGESGSLSSGETVISDVNSSGRRMTQDEIQAIVDEYNRNNGGSSDGSSGGPSEGGR